MTYTQEARAAISRQGGEAALLLDSVTTARNSNQQAADKLLTLQVFELLAHNLHILLLKLMPLLIRVTIVCSIISALPQHDRYCAVIQ
jgi:hypothetical protein